MKKFRNDCRRDFSSRESKLSALSPLLEILDSEKCAAWLMSIFHPGAPSCLTCGELLSEKRAASFRDGRRVKCQACGQQFRAWHGTPFQGAHMTPAEFILLRVAIAAEMDHAGLQQLLGRHGQFITTWRKKVFQFNSMIADR